MNNHTLLSKIKIFNSSIYIFTANVHFVRKIKILYFYNSLSFIDELPSAIPGKPIVPEQHFDTFRRTDRARKPLPYIFGKPIMQINLRHIPASVMGEGHVLFEVFFPYEIRFLTLSSVLFTSCYV